MSKFHNILFLFTSKAVDEMDRTQLRDLLERLGLSQADLARLLKVSPRTVARWVAEEDNIPGPVEGYLRLFEKMPKNIRDSELVGGYQDFPDGLYHLHVFGPNGSALIGLMFANGKILGSDSSIAYYGEYQIRDHGLRVKAIVTAEAKSFTSTVMGVNIHEGQKFNISISEGMTEPGSQFKIDTNFGQLVGQLELIRAI